MAKRQSWLKPEVDMNKLLPLLILAFCLQAQTPTNNQTNPAPVATVTSLIPTTISPLPTVAPPIATSASVAQVKAGQTVAEVHALIGEPNQPGYGQWERWNIPSDGGRQIVFQVKFADGIAEYAHSYVDQSDGSTGKDKIKQTETPSRAATVVNKVADAVDGLMLVHYCPQVYRIPLIFMDATAYQWLQACNANGFMLFGVYVYLPKK
jgi:hypothetical protein